MEYIKISKVDTLDNGFIIEFEEILGHYIYVAPNPPQQKSPDSSIVDVDEDDDDEIIWF